MSVLRAHAASFEPLPSLEEPWPGTTCPACGDELRIVGFCASCYEAAMVAVEARQHARVAQLAEARRRARAWQLGRVQS